MSNDTPAPLDNPSSDPAAQIPASAAAALPPATAQQGGPANGAAPSQTAADPAAVDPAVKPGDWPDDWREKYSNDPKVLARLQRYGSPKAAIDALFAAQKKISSGELKSVLKAEATPEEKAAWREENGIPATPKDYDLNLPNGVVIGENDKPIVDEFLTKAHEANMHPDQVKQTLAWYLDKQEQARIEMENRDNQLRMKHEDELRAEFGPEYRKNLMIANNVLESAFGKIKDKFLSARAADGAPFGSDPDVIRALVQLGREMNPIGTVVPGSGTNAVQAAENELNSLRKMMGDAKSEYWKGPSASANQARYRELVTALQKERR